uniref:Uncharacterized protein n=1 Tax=Chromera velia CCMP2878 TaxID=1169474 RepID=A0A0G4F8N6_9ALVE|eukprot:Cvel_15806.t1-p1 / transcript=Cvel_15806.t1 / gene=Cvel_15806 / organism=Chromera_velia_CCMP2878 / gene_product=hypothetical protein / transcript_product=hypothetical protein / location=Cvel_scaffold1187:14863-17136(-) / protein_length=758 / sequence_SO=supercontig / SO=protein_coding / is_pseudo=false
MQSSRVWLFHGGSFDNLKGRGFLRITDGGKYDQQQCTFDHDSFLGRHIGKALLFAWLEARASRGPNLLQSLQTLQTQQSPNHLAEWKMLQKCREFFRHVPGGVEVRDAPHASLPYDIEIRLSACPDMPWQRVQLKSASWTGRSHLAYVRVCKKRAMQTMPYDEADFDFLLVSPPQNMRPSTSKNNTATCPLDPEPTDRWRYFYFVEMEELVNSGVVSSERKRVGGVTGLSLDFQDTSFLRRGFRPLRFLRWRLDTSFPAVAGERFARLLSRGARGKSATCQQLEKIGGVLPLQCEGRQETQPSTPIRNEHTNFAEITMSLPAQAKLLPNPRCTSLPQIDSQLPSLGSAALTLEARESAPRDPPLCTGIDGLTLRDRYSLERAAFHLLRQSFPRSEHFDGLEEPAVPLPPFARVDLAVRPFGCKEDLWLPVQVKSTAHRSKWQKATSALWDFHGVRGYEGVVVCISLERPVHEKEVPERPKVWVFFGSRFDSFCSPGRLAITEDGKHDTEATRCSFGEGRFEGSHIGRRLSSIWFQAKKGLGVCRLRDLYTLQIQQSPNHLAEWRMLQNCLELFKSVPGGVDVREAPWPFDPHDIEIRLRHASHHFKKVQLKSAIWFSQSRVRPGVAFVNFNKKVRGVVKAYEEGDFQFLLVAPPKNLGALSQKPPKEPADAEKDPLVIIEKWQSARYLYVIPEKFLIDEGVVASKEKASCGLKGFLLDFSSMPVAKKDTRMARLLQWRLNTSDKQGFGKQLKKLFDED